MSETRKPFLSVILKPKLASRAPMKVEMFDAALFSLRTLVDVLGNPVGRTELDAYVRLRVNGKWFPARTATIYTREQSYRVIEQFIRGAGNGRTGKAQGGGEGDEAGGDLPDARRDQLDWLDDLPDVEARGGALRYRGIPVCPAAGQRETAV